MDSKVLLEIAARNSTIAKRILWDEPGWSPEAAMHIARAWEGLLRFNESSLIEAEHADAENESQERNAFEQLTSGVEFSRVLKRWSALGFVEDESGVQRLWREDLESFSAAELLLELDSARGDRLEGHLELLDTAEKAFRNRWYEEQGERNPKFSLKQIIAYGALPVLLIAACWYVLRDDPAWVDYYFQNTELKGAAIKGERQRDIRFNWSQKPPHQDIALENYSARFFACLRVDRRSKVSFQLGSDDGSRLFVEGEKMIDIWSPHAFMSRTRGKTLNAGSYPLKLEYFQEYGGASLRLDVRVEGRPIALSSTVRLLPPLEVTADSVRCH